MGTFPCVFPVCCCCPGGFALGLAGCQLGPLFVLCVLCLSPLCAQACPRALLVAAFCVVLRRATLFLLPHSVARSKSQGQPRFKGRRNRFYLLRRGAANITLPRGIDTRALGGIVAIFVIYPKASNFHLRLDPPPCLLYSRSAGCPPLHRLPSVRVQHEARADRHCFHPQRSSSHFHHLSAGLHHFQMQKINFDYLASFIPLGH